MHAGGTEFDGTGALTVGHEIQHGLLVAVAVSVALLCGTPEVLSTCRATE